MDRDNSNRDEVLDLAEVDFRTVLSAFDEGVIITDRRGRIIFYNDAQARIDGLAATEVLGRTVTEVYNLDEDSSKIMKCLRSGQAVPSTLFFYKTRRGKMANTIHSVFPLRRGGRVVGAVCIVKDYNVLERTIASSSDLRPHDKPLLGNNTRYRFTDLVGTDESFLRAVQIARLASTSDSAIMICGETGTGKELFAQSIHNYSQRAPKPFVGINCAAIPENLLEGLLFGTSRGAFTGSENKAGIFEQANGGTLFLDEVNSLPINLQAKLLRALQERKIRRIGAAEDIEIDLKVISSVNVDPRLAIQNGDLRLDLFYRLGVVFIHIPPLRARRGDLQRLTQHFIYKHNLNQGKSVAGVSDRVMAFFETYAWPGNVRELEHIIEGTMAIMGPEDSIEPGHLPLHLIDQGFRPLADGAPIPLPAALTPPAGPMPAPAQSAPALSETLPQSQRAQERDLLHQALTATRGHVAQAARRLGISRQLLHYKMKKLGLRRQAYR
jgi:arginine utilization regulatory protein